LYRLFAGWILYVLPTNSVTALNKFKHQSQPRKNHPLAPNFLHLLSYPDILAVWLQQRNARYMPSFIGMKGGLGRELEILVLMKMSCLHLCQQPQLEDFFSCRHLMAGRSRNRRCSLGGKFYALLMATKTLILRKRSYCSLPWCYIHYL